MVPKKAMGVWQNAWFMMDNPKKSGIGVPQF
jgi:hypothetical protein